MADIYRKAALDKLSNPEQLDRMIKISSPLSWLSLMAVLLMIAAVALWSVFGTLPEMENVNGIIVNSDNAYAVYSNASGIVEKINKQPGSFVSEGDVIAEIKDSTGNLKQIKADEAGVIGALFAGTGSQIFTGGEIARYTPAASAERVLICYVPLVQAQKLKEGMDVLVYPAAVDSQVYGHIEAVIEKVEEYAANISSLAYVLGSGNMIAEQFTAGGPVVEVICSLKQDSSTASGFYWSGEKGKNVTLAEVSFVSAKIIISENAPITKLINQ